MSKNVFEKYLKKENPDKAHSIFSASGSERWLGCPGSVRLSKGIPSVETKAALRGTHTHTLLQFILENEEWRGLLLSPQALKFKNEIQYDQAMRENALFAAEFVWDQGRQMKARYGVPIQMMAEVKVHLEGVGFGTSDVILYHPFGTLHVMDYKNGTKAVEPKGNTQGLYYAHAAADLFGWEFSDLHITIIQPNAPHSEGHIRTWKTDHDTLARAGDRFLKGVKEAKKPDAPWVKKDSWCYFCPARIKCPAHTPIRERKAQSLFGLIGDRDA